MLLNWFLCHALWVHMSHTSFCPVLHFKFWSCHPLILTWYTCHRVLVVMWECNRQNPVLMSSECPNKHCTCLHFPKSNCFVYQARHKPLTVKQEHNGCHQFVCLHKHPQLTLLSSHSWILTHRHGPNRKNERKMLMCRCAWYWQLYVSTKMFDPINCLSSM